MDESNCINAQLPKTMRNSKQFEVLLDPTKAFVSLRLANFWVPDLPLEVDYQQPQVAYQAKAFI